MCSLPCDWERGVIVCIVCWYCKNSNCTNLHSFTQKNLRGTCPPKEQTLTCQLSKEPNVGSGRQWVVFDTEDNHWYQSQLLSSQMQRLIIQDNQHSNRHDKPDGSSHSRQGSNSNCDTVLKRRQTDKFMSKHYYTFVCNTVSTHNTCTLYANITLHWTVSLWNYY